MSGWVKYNDNPCGKSVGDCAVRAVAVALGVDWYEAYDLMCAEGRERCNLPSADETWGGVLSNFGYKRWALPYGCITANDFCRLNRYGVFVLAFGGHVATAIDGLLYDAWDSSNETPIYVWSKKRPFLRR